MAYNRLCKKVGEIVKKEIFIDGPYITLGQLLKEESVININGIFS